VTLESNSGPASIEVTAGAHEFQAAVRLNSNSNLSVQPGQQLSFHNVVDLNGQTLSIGPDSRVVVNSRLQAGASGVVANSGNFGGVGRVNGNLLNLAGGSIAPGAAVGQIGELVIGGDYIQSSLGKLSIELAGDTAGTFDSLDVGGAAVLDGVLEISLLGGYSPNPGDRYAVLNAGASINAASLILTGQAWGFVPLVENGGNTLVIQFFDSDFNGDNVVKAADLGSWRAGFSSSGVTHAQGDADGDQDVDGGDFLIWQRQLGSGRGVGMASVVPEPTLNLLVAGILLGLLRRRRAGPR
jgi:hypothetical protein